uniref:Uncharacterized protein n=1 Tax=Trypanosoma congolense (strain IL3000) TaxID=1068625 RepID=G0UKD0_TRYCI|nr:conserved hypothetical protein [Trypanosoma congolense IL3000]
MSTPMTDDERAAKEARLRFLRSEVEAAGHPASTAEESKQQSAQDRQVRSNQEEYDDSEYNSDESDDKFLEGAENAAAVCMFTKPMGELIGQTLETEPSARRGIVGDFELLRLAKMGDLTSFKEFAALTAADPTTFRDNHGRNAMHYAADSGSTLLLQYLIDIKVPFVKDEKNMTPVDIATLNKHSEAVKLLAAAFPQAAELVKSYDEVLEELAPPPPRFTITKPAPPAVKDSRPRAFWKSNESGDSPQHGTGLNVSQLGEAHRELVLTVLGGLELVQDSQGFNNWLPPTERETLTAVLPRAVVVGATHEVAGKEALCAVIMAIPLGGSIAFKSGQLENTFLASQLALHATLRGANHAPRLLEEVRKAIQEKGATAVVFHSPLQLNVPAVGMLKWSRRSIDPANVFKRQYSSEVFPDFFQYDDALRADVIAKNAPPKSFFDSGMHRKRWCSVDRGNTEQLEHLQSFISAHASALFDVAYVPQTTDDLLASILLDGLSPFVFVTSEGVITDLVVLRVRPGVAREQGQAVAAVVCVYAIFTSFKGSAKADEVVALSHLLKGESVFIPNMFGFVDSDLSKGKFEELIQWREYLYVLQAVTESAVPPTALSKVAIPCLFI